MIGPWRRKRRWRIRNRGVAISPSEAQALREHVVRGPVVRGPVVRGQVVRGQKLSPFHGRVGGVALKPEVCARPKPGGSKSCEARNWARSMGG